MRKIRDLSTVRFWRLIRINCLLLAAVWPVLLLAAAPPPGPPPAWDEPEPVTIADPLEPANRRVFNFNDLAYFRVVKPTAEGYSAVLAPPARVHLGKAFDNLAAPARMANCLLQGDIQGGGIEFTRFLVNSTFGVLGLFDPAQRYMQLESQREDFGLTLGTWGVGEGLYLVLPFFGPSNVRDTLGLVGDTLLDPLSYVSPPLLGQGVRAYRWLNLTSLHLGEYEQFVEAALDPYASMRDAYHANRRARLQQ